MRTSRLKKSVAIVIATVLCLAIMAPFAGGASTDGIMLNMQDVSFHELVEILVDKEQGKTVKQLDILSTPVTLVISTPMPVSMILADLCKRNGMDLTVDGNTYIIRKAKSALAPSTAAQTAPITTDSPSYQMPLPGTGTYTLQNSDPGTQSTSDAKLVVAAINMMNMSAAEACWLLGVGSTAKSPVQSRRRTLDARVQNVLDPKRPSVKTSKLGGEYTSPMLGYLTPWLPEAVSSRGSTTDAYQGFPPGGFPPPGGVAPGNPPPGGVVPPAVTPPGTVPGTGTNNAQNAGGQLRNFIPEGVESIVGISSLNQLIVRAKTKEQIQQLADFLKLIDQPTKQVVVELMFVKMSVEDAFSLGSSFKITGAPFYVESQGSSSTGNFTVMYTQNNIQAQIATLLTNKRAKIVNAPRVVVQNGGRAVVEMEESFPFILTTSSTDIYGRITETPEIFMQPFSNGLEVNSATILPDNSVILDVTPIISDPSNAVEIPGLSNGGSVQGGSEITIETIVRVKNGESIMMGGFVSENEGTASLRVPLLSDLPIIGQLLFRSTNTSKTTSETLFFLTPTIIFDDKTNFDGMTTVPPVF